MQIKKVVIADGDLNPPTKETVQAAMRFVKKYGHGIDPLEVIVKQAVWLPENETDFADNVTVVRQGGAARVWAGNGPHYDLTELFQE